MCVVFLKKHGFYSEKKDYDLNCVFEPTFVYAQ